eukprot:m.745279 g.745279  ORF g.745279 m.745279 type:complete len:68 (-) comp58955_c0_seq8:3237-3440(-)
MESSKIFGGFVARFGLENEVSLAPSSSACSKQRKADLSGGTGSPSSSDRCFKCSSEQKELGQAFDGE